MKYTYLPREKELHVYLENGTHIVYEDVLSRDIQAVLEEIQVDNAEINQK